MKRILEMTALTAGAIILIFPAAFLDGTWGITFVGWVSAFLLILFGILKLYLWIKKRMDNQE